MSARPLPTDDPAAQGVDARGVHAFLDAVEAEPGIEPHSLMILRHGRLVASGWWAPYTSEHPQLLYSLSKSFTSTAAGLAAAEGLLSLDDTVVSYFPEFEADITDPRSRSMLVRHVAAMASGHVAETFERAAARDREELVRGFLLTPPDRAPGSVFAYNQPATYSLASIVQKVSGQSLTDFLRPRLFEPLGIGEAFWLRDHAGRQVGFSGLHTTTDALARLGQLYLQGGVWEGRRILPAAWVDQATRAQVATVDGTSGPESADWREGYGFQFWMARHGYRGDGAYGQYCLVLPEHDAVIVITESTELLQRVLDLVWEHLLPAFGPQPPDGRAGQDADLARRLAALELPPLAAKSAPPSGQEDWAGAEFTPEGGACAQQRSLTAVTVSPDAEGSWTLALAEGDARLALRGGDGWTSAGGPGAQVPTAVSGGWTGPGVFAAAVVFPETPHTLTVTCSLTSRTFTARWNSTPLHPGPLASHRAPRP